MKLENLLVYLTLLLIPITSCNDDRKVIWYEYNGQFVTRVDIGVESFFYYGKFNLGDIPKKNYLKTYFSGFDGFMSGFIIFKEESVFIMITDANVDNKLEEGCKLKQVVMSNAEYISWQKRIENNYSNIVKIEDRLNVERRINKKLESFVKVYYNPQLPRV